MEIFFSYIPRFFHKDPQKTRSIFEEYFLETLGSIISNSTSYEKKELIIPLLYLFCPNNAESKHQLIAAFESKLNNKFIFMQSLVVLLNQDIYYNELLNKILYDDFLYYAKTGVFSSMTKIRTPAICLLVKLAELKYDLLLDYSLNHLEQWNKENWWENKCLFIILASKLIYGIIESDNYRNNVKRINPQSNRNYNIENEMLIAKMKSDIEKLGKFMVEIAKLTQVENILKCFIINTIDLLGDSKVLVEHTVLIIINSDEEFRRWFYDNNESVKEDYLIYNDKSTKHKLAIDSQKLKRFSKEFLMSIIELVIFS